MMIEPLQSPRLHQRIAQEIEQLILAGSFRPGTRLPAERQLATSLRVSRSSLREALSALELQGILEIKVGSGAWVRQRPASGGGLAPAAFPVGIAPFELLQARRIVEPEAAALAARHATPAQRVAIAKAFDRLERAMRAKRPDPQADKDFHVLIARACGNAAMAMLVERLWQEFQSPLAQRMEALYVTRERRSDNIEEHRAIRDAIVAAQPANARQAMRRHLKNSERQRLTELLQPGNQPA